MSDNRTVTLSTGDLERIKLGLRFMIREAQSSAEALASSGDERDRETADTYLREAARIAATIEAIYATEKAV